MCLREELNTAVEYLGHIRAGCKVRQKSFLVAKELKAKGYNIIPGHSLCLQFVKKYDYIMEGDQNESDVEQNESDIDYFCETPRKKLNTSLDIMDIPCPFTWCCSTQLGFNY